MKAVLAFALLLTVESVAADSLTGARGGKLLDNEPPRAELLIESDGQASVAFYDQSGKQVAPAGQSVVAMAEAPEGKVRIEFEQKGDLLAAKNPLPAGENYTVVLQLRKDTAAKPQNFRVKYDMHICGECNHPEYACTCQH